MRMYRGVFIHLRVFVAFISFEMKKFYENDFNVYVFVVCLQTEGVWSTGVIPRGTRFGPFEGVPTPNYPSDKQSWRYFWRVCTVFFSNFIPKL